MIVAIGDMGAFVTHCLLEWQAEVGHARACKRLCILGRCDSKEMTSIEIATGGAGSDHTIPLAVMGAL
jgi:hypothetical protein